MSETKPSGNWEPEIGLGRPNDPGIAGMVPKKALFPDDVQLIQYETACYIAQMSTELGAMARGAELSLLSYFLDMAAAEAREVAGKIQPEIEIEPVDNNSQSST